MDEEIDAGGASDQDVVGNIQTTLDSNSTKLPNTTVKVARALLLNDTNIYHLRDI